MSLRPSRLKIAMVALIMMFTAGVFVASGFIAVPALNPELTLNLPSLLIFPLVTLPLLPGLLAP